MSTRHFFLVCSLLAPWILCADDLPASNQGKEASGLVSPSSRYQVTNGWNMFFNAEFLYWTAKEDGLYYAQNGYTGVTDTPIPPNESSTIFNGHLAKVHPHFRPGFRIGFGGNMEYDEWDILVNWTWFQSTAHGHKHGPLLTLWGTPPVSGQAQASRTASSANADWDLLLNLFDAEMGRSFWVGRHLSVRPFMGLRGAWIDQHFHIHYDLATTPGITLKTKALSDFSGGGLRVGTDFRFTLLGGWSLYGLASGSLLYGFYDAKFVAKSDDVTAAKAKDGFRQAAANAQLEMGFRWDSYFHKDRYHLGLYAGWEQNIWFGANKMNHFFGSLGEGNLEQMNGDLTLSGGTFGLRFDY